ncbi:MAG: efflux RND transporter periplasmic adaptor subunit, partial [candidate division Zixibacteria bacterium]|nr:efflux RND transporter periplasmic adaptor subunit [candidate division Zixibacteria bacterium]
MSRHVLENGGLTQVSASMTKLIIRSRPIVFGLVVLAVLGCHSDENQPRQSEAIRVTTVRPQRTEVVHSLTVVGHAEPNEQAILYAKAAGYLESITADIGSWVKSGQVLAEINDPETRHDWERQRADRDMREQIYQRLSATKDKSPDMVSQLDVDRAKGEYEASAAAEKRLQQMVGNALIRAPFDGVITDRWVDPGALIQLATTSQPASARIARIMNFDTVRFVVEISEKDAIRIAVNSDAIVRFSDIPGKEFPGRVARYAWAVAPTTRTMTAEVDFPNPDHVVRPGMYGKAEITVE